MALWRAGGHRGARRAPPDGEHRGRRDRRRGGWFGITRTCLIPGGGLGAAGRLRLILEDFATPPYPVSIVHPAYRLGSAKSAPSSLPRGRIFEARALTVTPPARPPGFCPPSDVPVVSRSACRAFRRGETRISALYPTLSCLGIAADQRGRPTHISRQIGSRAMLRRNDWCQASRSDRHRRPGLDAGRSWCKHNQRADVRPITQATNDYRRTARTMRLRVGAAAVVLHAPAIRRLGEFLLVHHHAQHVERQTLDRRGDMALQQDRAAADLPDLERDEPAGADHAGKLSNDAAHECLPCGSVRDAGRSGPSAGSMPANQQRSQLSPS